MWDANRCGVLWSHGAGYVPIAVGSDHRSAASAGEAFARVGLGVSREDVRRCLHGWPRSAAVRADQASARYAHAKQCKRANRLLKKLRTYLGRVIRDIARKIEGQRRPRRRRLQLHASAQVVETTLASNPSGANFNPFRPENEILHRRLLEKSGAGDGNRTHDIQLGKLSFYH
jgi:hypothetical protein